MSHYIIDLEPYVQRKFIHPNNENLGNEDHARIYAYKEFEEMGESGRFKIFIWSTDGAIDTIK